jgi:hypothetical protein
VRKRFSKRGAAYAKARRLLDLGKNGAWLQSPLDDLV